MAAGPIQPEEFAKALELYCVGTGTTASEGEDHGQKRYLLSPGDIVVRLEDALVEERARALWFEGDDPCDPPNLDWKTEPNDIPESVRLLWGESARRQLQAEGKIGPEDAKPRSWQVTEERKAAMQHILMCHHCRYDDSSCKASEVLRAMLEGVGQ